VTTPLDVQGSATEAQPESVLSGVQAKVIEGRSLGQIAWLRLKRDKVAMVSAGIILVLIVFAIVVPFINNALGNDPNATDYTALNQNTGAPLGSFGGASGNHIFGVDDLGRDIFARIAIGARVSLIVALLATLLSVGLGTLFGTIAGYFGGRTDTVISRVMDTLLAFPQLLFAIAIVAVLRSSNVGGGLTASIAILIIVIGFFSWPYFGRIIRGQVLSLREKEFIEAARSLGATSPRILFRELLPNLWGPILVYATLIIPTNILFEAALSYLGVGIPLPTASWGNMLSEATEGRFYNIDPTFFVIPGLAIFITVMAFNLFGDGLRDALDPRANR
jgi:peptide/nickel transport system permease protein/oligopeptide transport system permease protein